MKAKTVVAIVVVLGTVLVTAGALWYVKFGPQTRHAQAARPEPAEAVEIVTARALDYQPRADLVGTVIALRSVVVTNEVSGVITEIGFDSGDVVEEGQTLVVLESSVEQADLTTARANVRVMEAAAKAIEANISLWQTNLARIEPAVAANAAPATELDNARAQLTSARAQLERAQAEIEQAKARVVQVEVQIGKKTIKAPFRARAGIRLFHPGQYVAEGTQIVGLQAITDRIYLDFALPQEYAMTVKPGDSVMANSSMLGSGPVKVDVTAVDAVINTETRNVRVRSSVPNADGRLRPGMFVDISVPVGQPVPSIVVPSTAVRRASFGNHVFIIVPGEAPNTFRAKQVFVKLGAAIGEDVIVTEGLTNGQEVAAAGSFKLRDGALVMKAAPGAPSAPTAPPAK